MSSGRLQQQFIRLWQCCDGKSQETTLNELAEMLKPVITALVNGAPVYTPLLERFAEVYRDKQPEAVFGTEEAAPVYDTSAQVLELYPRLFIIDEYYTLTYQQSSDTPLCNHLEIGVLYDVAKLYQKRDIPLREIAGCVKVIGATSE